MKKAILIASLIFSSISMAETALQCVVPTQGTDQIVQLTLDLSEENSIDFIMITVDDFNKENQPTQSVFYTQMDKGSTRAQLSQGYLNMLVMTETTSQENGVIHNSGFFAVSVDQPTGLFSGFLAANNNVYPIECKPNIAQPSRSRKSIR